MTTKPYQLKAKPYLIIGWLYPELMSTYGDRGNIIVLQKIAEDNGINVEIVRINQTSDANLLTSCDLIFMGGAQDLQQEIVNEDLLKSKGKVLKQMVEDGTPGLYICGAYQFLGKYYKDSYGTKIEGLGIFDMYTQSFKNKPRLIGNIVINTKLGDKRQETGDSLKLVGFENHGGRTFLADKSQAFAKVTHGFGNNGKDKTEGIIYKNSVGTYLHGPILPSNPELAVYLLKIALNKKYGKDLKIEFNDVLSKKAKQALLKRLKAAY